VKVVQDLSDNYPDDLSHYTKFNEMGDDSNDNVLFADLGAVTNPFLRFQHKDYKRKVAWTGEQPCAFTTGRKEIFGISGDFDDYFDKFYTVCPYSAEWLNTYFHKKEKFELAIIPYNENDIPQREYEKEFDAIYWGNLHFKAHLDMVDAISMFNSNFYTVHPAHWSMPMDMPTMQKYASLITGVSTPRREMWEVLRKTKIFVITNVLPLREEHIKSIKTIPNWEKNRAFSHMDQMIAPQMKTRAVEAAFNKTLCLVKKDPWNVIEEWFEPGVDFVYYENDAALPNAIETISKNWKDYEFIVENAYKKAVENYTSQKLFQRMSGEK
jgi:glycosyltransferase involved in cell wall biosynthesis